MRVSLNQLILTTQVNVRKLYQVCASCTKLAQAYCVVLALFTMPKLTNPQVQQFSRLGVKLRKIKNVRRTNNIGMPNANMVTIKH